LKLCGGGRGVMRVTYNSLCLTAPIQSHFGKAASSFEGIFLYTFDSKGFIQHWEVALNNIIYFICIPQQLCGTDLNIDIYPWSVVKEHNSKGQNVNTVHGYSFDPYKGTSWNVYNRLSFRYFSQSLTDVWSETSQNASFVKLKKNIIGAFVLRKQKGWTGLVVGLQCVTAICGTFKITSRQFIIYSHTTMTYTTLHKL
jgi:hypothetical protein